MDAPRLEFNAILIWGVIILIRLERLVNLISTILNIINLDETCAERAV